MSNAPTLAKSAVGATLRRRRLSTPPPPPRFLWAGGLMSAAAGGLARFGLIALPALALGALLLSSASPVWAQAVDYDDDNDNLIEVSTLDQLNAIRWDLDGNGAPDAANANDYALAFPNAATGMGCPITAADADDNDCTGYELDADLNFNTDTGSDSGGAAVIDADDDYYNGGDGWEPLGDSGAEPLMTTFEGNNHTISNLFINRTGSSDNYIGLFGQLGGATVTRVHLVGAKVTGNNDVGALVGHITLGTVSHSSSSGTVSGVGKVGGLVGAINSDRGGVEYSRSGAVVTATGTQVGGLIGFSAGQVRVSYATGAVSGSNYVGGLVGNHTAAIFASYATGAFSSNRVSGGLVGWNGSAIAASYATGAAVGRVASAGGLIGVGGGGSSMTNGYWDVDTSGIPNDNDAHTGVGKTTVQLQSPTQTDGYAGIYANWNIDVDADSNVDDPWDFGTASEYPALKADSDGDGRATAYEFGRQGRSAPLVDYDDDNDGLIEVVDLDQLNAMRWDLDGDGAPDVANANDYALAFPNPATGMGCPITATDADDNDCTGYELDANLDFNTDTGSDSGGAAVIDAADDYYNSGSGWVPIGDDSSGRNTWYNANFEGNGHTISNLFISRNNRWVGLFGISSEAGFFRNVGLVDVNVTGWGYTGALIGHAYGTVDAAYSTGTVVSNKLTKVGGLIGYLDENGSIQRSYSTASVTGVGTRLGGLVGANRGPIRASYATGAVAGSSRSSNYIGGLVGESEGDITASYATGAVTGVGSDKGGLIGRLDKGTITNSYWDVTSSGIADDSDATTGVGKTTLQLQSPAQTDGYAGIYADWDIDVDNADVDDDTTTETDDPWDFGTASEYPALKVEWDGDGTPTAYEFGRQGRSAPGVGPPANGPPVFTPGYDDTPNIAEGVTAVGTYAATDPEGDQLTYAVTGTDASDFAISGAGALTLASASNHETKESYSVNVTVHDGKNAAGGADTTVDLTLAITVTVDDTLEPPTVPTSLGVVPAANGLTVTWTAPVMPSTKPALDDYDVQHALRTSGDGDPAAWAAWVAFNHVGTGTTATITGLVAGSTYQVQVMAKNNEGESAWTAAVTGVPAAPVDYDLDDDGLIEVDSLTKLNAIRWDLDGDGAPASASAGSYAAVFPYPEAGMGCPITNADGDDNDCTGYELTADLDFDQNNDKRITSADAAWWNSGAGWAAIGNWGAPFNATFDGGGHTVSHMYIRVGGGDVGLFGSTDTASVIRNLGMVSPSIDRTGSLALDSAAAVAGSNRGTIDRVFVTGGSIWAYAKIGGVAGHNRGTVSNSYSRMTVTGNTQVGGLVGWNETASGIITNSYAAGGVATHGEAGTRGGVSGTNAAADFGGLVGQNSSGAAVTASYWDTEASGQAASAGGTAKTTAQLQTPTGATGIYSAWGTVKWDFGTASQYPALKYDTDGVGGATWQEFGGQVRIAPVDYDTDDDGLIEVDSLVKLNAIRYDLNGDGGVTPADKANYDTAFPNAQGSMGCLNAACAGYELTDDLNFDQNNDNAITSTDAAWWNSGAGWAPIGDWANPFNATFDGRGHTISNLYIRIGGGDVGLFGSTDTSSVIRNLGMVNPSIDRTGALTLDSAAAVAGSNRGAIQRVFVSGGSVWAFSKIGGLVGHNRGAISDSYSRMAVTGNTQVGGLVGWNENASGTITNSYAMGKVATHGETGTPPGGGSRQNPIADVGGLVGKNDGGAAVTASYWDTEASRQATSAGGAGAVGRTTAQLQSPTSAVGIYSAWAAATWDFGTSSQYPALKYDTNGIGGATWQEFGSQARAAPPPPTDYDTDDDGLIEVDSLAQLNAIRYDLDGNGAVTAGNQAAYELAFTNAAASMGCAGNTCTGYELTDDLDFDTDDDGDVDSSDDYPSWTAIGAWATPFTATFDGGGHTISNMRIRAAIGHQGLFGSINSPGVLRNVAVLDVDIDRTGSPTFNSIGGLLGSNRGAVEGSYSTGAVTGFENVGGLVGDNRGVVTNSYSSVTVNGNRAVGGLVGFNRNSTARITNSYAVGAVSAVSMLVSGGNSAARTKGGLVGEATADATVTASYWDATTSAQAASAGGAGAVSQNTAGLQSPTSATGIYSTWAAATWDFGTSSQYPALKYDTDKDSTATAYEFGRQGRSAPVVSVNGPPTFDAGADATPNIAEGATAVGTYAATDPDSDTLTYAVIGTDASEFAISGAGVLTLNDAANHETKPRYSVSVTVHDGKNAAGANDATVDITLALTVTVDDTLEPPTAPTNLQVFPVVEGLRVTWTAPVMPAAKPPLSDYDVQHSVRTSGDGVNPVTWGAWLAFDHVGTGTTATITGLTAGSTYQVQALAKNNEGSSPWTAAVTGVPLAQSTGVDYDGNDDGLIEVSSLKQLNAIRWDPDGDGDPIAANADDYALAFPNPATGMGCVLTDHDSDAATPDQPTCTGYELTADLDFDEDGDGVITPADGAWNEGLGWDPLGVDATGKRFTATFDGKGHRISNLYINRPAETDVGLWRTLRDGAVVRNLGLERVSVTGGEYVGAFVGSLDGTLEMVYATGYVRAARSATGPPRGTSAGGLAGYMATSDAAILDSYANVTVTADRMYAGGLVGSGLGNCNWEILRSYARGRVSSAGLTGGIIAKVFFGARLGIGTGNYWDTETSGHAIADEDSSVAALSTGKTTAELQAPVDTTTDMDGATVGVQNIYATWDAAKWDFGTANEYPALKFDTDESGSATAAEFGSQSRVAFTTPPTFADGPSKTVTVPENTRPDVAISGSPTATDADAGDWLIYSLAGADAAYFVIHHSTGQISTKIVLDHETRTALQVRVVATDSAGMTASIDVTISVDDVSEGATDSVDYDSDDDGLIEVDSLAQLDAMRWDLAGDGVSANVGYLAVFTTPAEGMGCPNAVCRGYELTADLDFDENGDGQMTEVDDRTYWSGGDGWAPIGRDADGERYTGAFEGNGHTISHLFISRPQDDENGLFGSLGRNSSVENLGLENVNVTGAIHIGALAGHTESATVKAVYATGAVSGDYAVGGLIGSFVASTMEKSYATVTVTATGNIAGGLIGEVLDYRATRPNRIRASYATGAVSGDGHVGGLIGQMMLANSFMNHVTASYAAGAVSGNSRVGGLIGLKNQGLLTVTDSYWDTQTSGQRTSAGGVGKTTSDLQTPEDYGSGSDIYANWNLNLDGQAGGDDPWHFGTTQQYPALKAAAYGGGTAYEFGGQYRSDIFVDGTRKTLTVTEGAPANQDIPGSPVAQAPAAGATLTYALSGTDAGHFDMDAGSGQLKTQGALNRAVKASYSVVVTATYSSGTSASITVTINVNKDYDADGDGLIEVSFIVQLNAIRYDLDGNGRSGQPLYARAFPNSPVGMGCPDADHDSNAGTPDQPTCTGYELIRNLDFDTHGNDGTVTSADTSWFGGKGWIPLGSDGHPYVGTFDGGGYTMSNMLINRPNISRVGLFGAIGSGGVIRNLGLVNATVTGKTAVGSLAGLVDGTVESSYSTGSVTGGGTNVGGLVGRVSSSGEVRRSYTTADVSGSGVNLGGLAGFVGGKIEASYAAGNVTGGGTNVGGLVGELDGGTVTASYARGQVQGSTRVGGLVGRQRSSPTVTDSYWDTTTSGQGASAGGVGKTTSALQSPTQADGYAGIYANWNIDMDGDSNTDDDPWDFGTASQYPALKAEWDRDGTPSAYEFGRQGRSAPALVTNRPPVFMSVAYTDSTGTLVPAAPTIAQTMIPDEEQTAAGTVTAAVDPEGDALTYQMMTGAGDGDHALFNFNAGTRALAFKAAPNFEATPPKTTYTVKIRVRDTKNAQGTGDNTWDSTITVTINLQNVNEAPEFSPKTQTMTPNENQTAAGTVTAAVDPDANPTLTYRMLTTTGDHALFTFNTTTRALTFKAAPNFEAKDSYTVSIQVRDSLDDAGTADTAWDATVAVTINVTNVNEAPTFPGTTATREVAENGGANANVGLPVTATDVDSGDTRAYALSGADSGSFTISSSTGQITADASLNFEAVKNTFTVVVTATDDGNLTDTITVTINVTNVNEAPTFPGTTATREVAENGGANANVGLPVTATDVDSGDTRAYALSGADSGSFTISSSTGQITADASLNFEAVKNTFTVVVTATDDGNLTDTITVTINVTNVNEAPTFPGTTATREVAENGGANANVGLPVTATDVDSGDTRAYALSGADSGSFTISSSTGQITADASLNFEAVKNTFTVVVTATDDGNLTDTITVTINVTNVNEAPTFPGTTATREVAENGGANANVGLPVTATDVDSGDTRAYALSGADSGSFTISSSTGQITADASLNFEAVKNTFTVVVTATDDGNLTDTITVTINVTNVNEAPTFPGTTATREVAENGGANANVGLPVTATDVDSGDTRAYALSGADSGSFTISSSTGQITADASLNFEAVKNTFTVVVTATDDGNLTDTITVTINVTNVNEAPTFPGTTATREVAENGGANANVGLPVTATDVDSGDTRAYALSGADSGSFTISSSTGQITADASLNFEAVKNTFTVVVTATDDGNLTDTITVTINVTNVNEAPTFPGTTATRSVAENGGANANVGLPVTATDVDSGDTREYALSGADSGSFTISSSTGQITADASLNFEAVKNTFTVVVTATDDGNLTDTITVTINVTNVNEAPTFPGTTATRSVAENGGANANVGLPVTATDVDSGDTRAYALSGADSGSFTISSSTGQITADASLNFEAVKNTFTVVVTATDDGNLTDTITVTINVTNVNEAPTFPGTTATRSVAENGGANANVGLPVTATDVDSGDTRAYALSGADSGSFTISSSTGQITADASLNFEAVKNTFTVVVTATDDGNLTDTITVTINVTNVNEAPTFPGTTATREVAENGGANANVGLPVTATDVDSGDTRAYALSGADSGSFTISSSTGQITADASLNFEAVKNTFTVVVTATDDGNLTDTITVTINVTDAPERWTPPTNMHIDVVTLANRIRVTWTAPAAADNIGKPALTGYKVQWRQKRTASAAWAPDWVDFPRTGLGVTNDITTYTVTADDGTTTTHTVVTGGGRIHEVRVCSLNTDGAKSTDSPKAEQCGSWTGNALPAFTEGTRTTRSVAENTAASANIGLPVGAADSDAGDTLIYSMTVGTHSGKFTIDGATGQLKTKDPLDHETAGSYDVYVKVNDGNNGIDGIMVTITVTDVNEPPAFDDGAGPTARSVSESAAAGDAIGDPVEATDPDTKADPKDTLTYALDTTTGDHANFDIDTATGQLEVKDALDYETKTSYSITVTVSDGNGGTDSIDVTITVTNVNEKPAFPAGAQTLTPNENQTAAGTVTAATDPEGDTLTYRMLPDTGDDDSFNFNAGTRTLTFKTAPDFEAKDTYTVSIQVKDSKNAAGTASLTWDATVVVTVDVQDVSERPSAPTGLGVLAAANGLRVSWTAPDMTGKPPVTGYKLHYSRRDFAAGPGQWGNWVDHAHAGTGTSTTITGLTAGDTYRVQVRAANDDGDGSWTSPDTGVPTAPPVSNAVPVFTDGASTTRSVAENTAAGTNIGLPIAATDADAGDTLVYAIDATTGDHGHFAIDWASGQLKTKSALDYESNNRYTVVVTVSDGNGGTDSITVTIDVTDVVNEPPEVVPPPANRAPSFDEGASAGRSVAENTPAGRNIGLPLAATDPDSDPLTYALGGTDSGHFALAGNQLQTSGALDYEGVKSSYSVIVTVSDGNGGTDSIDVTITVTNVDDTPVVTPTPVAPTGTLAFDKVGVARRTVDAYAPVGTAVGAPVTATVSAGMAGPFYSVYTRSSPFTVDRLTGQLRTARKLGPADEYTIQLLATDGKGRLDVIGVIITVTGGRANRDPVFREGASATRSVVAGSSRGVRVGRPVTATDPDGDALFYMVSGTDSSHFSIGSGSGQIKVGRPLTKSSYSFEVVVGDLKGGVDVLDITITVTAVDAPPVAPTPTPTPNRAPSFDEGASAGRSVAENTPAGRNIGLPLAATDPDSDSLTYALGGTDSGHFALSGNQLRTSGALDYEGVKNSYSVTVTVSDGRGGTDSIDVTVTVTNVDEAPVVAPTPANRAPSFDEGASASRSVAENTPAGTDIGLPLAATDPDGDSLTYALSGTDSGHFALSGNQLRTSGDYAGVKSSYSVTVYVSDGKGGTDSIDVTVTVTNVDEAPVVTPPTANRAPAFDEGASAGRSVAENTAAGRNIGLPLAATDPEGDPLTYALGGADSGHFALSGNRLQTSGALDYEGQNSYAVTVTVSDARGGTDTIDVTITVTNVDEPPGALPGLAVFEEVNGIRVSWSAPDMTGKPPVTGYDVQYKLVTATDWNDHSHSGAGTTIQGLTAGSTYKVRVRAKNAEGNSVWASAQGTPTAAPVTPVPPGATTNLEVTPGYSKLRLTWNMPDMTGKPPITHFEVQYKLSIDKYWGDFPHDSTVSRVTIDFLGGGLSYDVRVRAVNSAGSSDWVSSSGTTK